MKEEIVEIANLLEGNRNMVFAKKVEEKLTELGFTVYLTRNNDEYITINERIRRIEDFKAEAAIAIDTNWSQNPNQKGIETYYGNNKPGELLAKKIQKELVKSTHLYNRGFLPSSNKAPQSIYLLTNCMVTTVVTLLGFNSNPHERELHSQEEFVDIASTAFARGIYKYFDIGVNLLKIAK